MRNGWYRRFVTLPRSAAQKVASFNPFVVGTGRVLRHRRDDRRPPGVKVVCRILLRAEVRLSYRATVDSGRCVRPRSVPRHWSDPSSNQAIQCARRCIPHSGVDSVHASPIRYSNNRSGRSTIATRPSSPVFWEPRLQFSIAATTRLTFTLRTANSRSL